jgi:hypothetical protein
LADAFPDGRPPLWYDEGIALLADSPVKQQLHFRDLAQGMHLGEHFSLTDVLTARRYPANRLGVFYGQCASLTHLLLIMGPPERIHHFARRSEEIGINLALKECYGITGVSELEQKWRENLIPSSNPVLASVLLAVSNETADDRRDLAH